MNIEARKLTVPDAAWRRSSYSSGEGGECVEVAATAAALHVRDSKRVGGPMLSLSPEAWAAFVGLAARQAD
ncbi:DUF397 domain-containing protein [Streptomyces sp. RKND-216]|uniref:DUF397 domain-containing protein n=1 Tax=Streptomyces sp. RKND-216 TaxID=2562581 RepID=UPI00040F3A5D|nr:DUF397 domain-containing protein [Streptomyces sp. RKND-216]THA26822.1 DUF397 domain-containing protein [Streptomyces sp. RKND-216]